VNKVRYLAIFPMDGRPLTMIGPARPCETDLVSRIDHERFRVLGTDGLRAIHADTGAILGLLFDRGQRTPANGLAERDWAEIARSRGHRLIERFWGNYVAIIADGDEVAIVRAPFSDLGCYYRRDGNALHVASDVSLLLAAAGTRRISAEQVARHIAWPDWRFGETCLEGIEELRGGERLTFAAGEVRLERLWTPWAFIAPERAVAGEAEVMRGTRDAIELAVAARAAICRRPLALLSGGLDSSVLASALRSAGADFAALNLRAADAASDETAYARCVVHALGVDLRIERLATNDVDVRRSGAADLPYPVHRGFTQAQDAIAQRIADALGCDAVFDGGGGDNVFFASRSVAILADCLLRGGFDRRFLSVARTLGDLAGAGLPRLVAKAVHRAWWRSPAPRIAASDRFLTPEVRAGLRQSPPHLWFQPPPSALPGRAAHVALLVPAQNMVEAVNAGAPYPAISPLASQPVIEAALRIPSWRWIAPGYDRAVVRAAYRDRLPAAIIDRRSKGTPTSFVAQIFERNRATIRDMLLGGWLAKQHLLDTEALSQALAGDTPVRDLGFAALMTFLDVEAWARAQG
jgi:asparagine synthase (glutamine-hydrolysing)